MSKETVLEKIRAFIGGIGWRVFLWSIKMTQDQYLSCVIKEGGLTPRALDAAGRCACGLEISPDGTCPSILRYTQPRQ